jgi:hypothetical protein
MWYIYAEGAWVVNEQGSYVIILETVRHQTWLGPREYFLFPRHTGDQQTRKFDLAAVYSYKTVKPIHTIKTKFWRWGPNFEIVL